MMPLSARRGEDKAGGMNSEMLVLDDPRVIRPGRLTDRVRARLFGGVSLDYQLAAGRAPESSGTLAARARHIVELRRRETAARNWDHLLAVARRGDGKPGPARRIRASEIVAAQPAIYELVRRLRAPLPVTARGVAMAEILLTDGAGPVYSARSRVDLTTALESAITQLDPALPLMQAS
jgi:hypothetical protein